MMLSKKDEILDRFHPVVYFYCFTENSVCVY